jgi:hypothetical protein
MLISFAPKGTQNNKNKYKLWAAKSKQPEYKKKKVLLVINSLLFRKQQPIKKKNSRFIEYRYSN